MILYILILIGELITLWLLSRKLSQNLFTAIFLLTTSRPVAISVLSILFFPGTVIHELAHLFTAEILGVRTSGLTLVPEGIEEKNVRTGSVSIAQSDPIRRAIIGIAPIFVGMGALFTIFYYLPHIPYSLLGIPYYLLFVISNTMFSSPEDMDGFWPVVGVITLLSMAAYIAGIRINLTEPTLTNLTIFFQSVAVNLGYIAGLNILLFIISKGLIRGVEKLTKRKLTTR